MERASVHVVILAAGRGSRLGALGIETPKWLLDVHGKTLADHQLEAVSHAEEKLPGSVSSVRVITGHAAEAIERFLARRGQTGVELVHNPHFARLNNWYSVLLAMRSIPEAGASRVVLLNGDLFADPPWMAEFLIDSARTSCEALIGVDLERFLTDESMMVSLEPDGAHSTATLGSIGKVAVNDPVGEYVGMLMARGSTLQDFREALEGFVGRPDASNEWYESAVRQTAEQGSPWTIWPTPDSGWVEIDDDRDYTAALELRRSA